MATARRSIKIRNKNDEQIKENKKISKYYDKNEHRSSDENPDFNSSSEEKSEYDEPDRLNNYVNKGRRFRFTEVTYSESDDNEYNGHKKRRHKRLYPDLTKLDFDSDRKKRYGVYPIILIGVGFFFFILGFIILHTYLPEHLYHENVKQDKNLSIIHAEIKHEFRKLFDNTRQPRHFWIQVMSQIEEIAAENPLQPSVLFTIVPLDSQKTTVCLLQKIQEIISNAFEDPKIVMMDSESSTWYGYNMTIELDNTLNQLNRNHIAVIYNMEKFPASAGMTLHGYCDNENAPYKRKVGKEAMKTAASTMRSGMMHIPSSSRWFVRIAGLSGASAVALGAYGAHVFYQRDYPEELKQVYETANRYHFLHSLALLGVPLCRRPMIAGSLIAIGSLIFSGTCYYYALTGSRAIRQYTPYGGMLLIFGWLAMML